jgi:starvation-inducible DNA-binding protein
VTHTSVPGLESAAASEINTQLSQRLLSLIDLQLTLKHVHWNVTGMSFIAVHEMLDEHVAAVRSMTDEVAERIAILGGEPNGTPGHLVEQRSWDDYPIGRDGVVTHLRKLDEVYEGIISDHRSAIEEVGKLDPVTEDLLIGQTAKLELQQWFIRAHVEHVGDTGTNGRG